LSRGNLPRACKPPVVYHSEVEVLNEEQKAVFNTLVYSDIFDYPLTPEGTFLYLIGDKPYGRQEINDALEGLKQLGIIWEKGGLFFLRDREYICDFRVKRQKWSEEKSIKVKKLVWLFRLIPWVQMVAVTGAVAAGNAEEISDIDLMIIADSRRVWLARFLILGFLKTLGLRVDLQKKIFKDRFCVNLFIAGDKLEYPQKNLYTANEIARIRPIFERGEFYQKFLMANQWILRFLPNLSLSPSQKDDQPVPLSGMGLVDFFEKITRSWQIKRIRGNFPLAVNIDDKDLLSFQPNDCSQRILDEFQKREKQASS